MSDTENEMRKEEKEHPNEKTQALTHISHRIARTALGQFTIRRLHAVLVTIENTAKWSCPIMHDHQLDPDSHGSNDETDASERPHAESLVRPLPWIFFLPALAILRMIRFTMSAVAMLFGWSPVEPPAIVHWLQSQRRSLRALRFQGLQDIRTNKEATDQSKPPTILDAFMRVTRRSIGRQHDEPETQVMTKPHQTSTGKRRRSVDADNNDDDYEESILDALNRTYTENETDVTFELDAVSDDSQSSDYESLSDSGCSEPVIEGAGKKSRRRKRKVKKIKDENNVASGGAEPQDLIGMSSGFESNNGNAVVTQSETEPSSSAQHTEDELNATTIDQPIRMDVVGKEESCNNEIEDKLPESPERVSECNRPSGGEDLQLTPTIVIDYCAEKMNPIEQPNSKTFDHQQTTVDRKPFQRTKSNRKKKSKFPFVK